MKPWVSIVSGVSIDGKISPDRGVPSKHTMPLPLEVRKYLHSLRAKFDAISVGCNTVRLDNPYLRVEYVEGKNPVRVIPCNRLDISPDMNVFEPPESSILITSEEADSHRIEAFRKKGVLVLTAGKKKVNLKVMLEKIYQLGIRSLMVEGGAKLNGSLISQRLVDELIIIHHPLVMCSGSAPSFAEGKSSRPVLFRLTEFQVIEGFLITRWVLEKTPQENMEKYSFEFHTPVSKCE